MKSAVFDTGPVISLAMNNLLWLLEPLKEKFNGEFYITKAIERELITRPLETKKFKFEALQVLQQINRGALKILDEPELKQKTLHLLNLANNSFKAYDNPISIVNYAEIEVLVTAIHLKSSAVIIDERTTRELVERPVVLKKILSEKLHTDLSVNKNNIKEFQKETKGLRLIRSVELVAIAYELGLLDSYLAQIPNPKKTLLESVLWGVKLNGCAVSNEEIERIIKLEIK